MKDVFKEVVGLILAVIGEILNLLDDAIPILLLVAYRLIIIILLYDIVKHLETIIRITKYG